MVTMMWKPNVKKEEIPQIVELAKQGHSDQELSDTFATFPKVIEQIRTGTFNRGGYRGPRGPRGPYKKTQVSTVALKEIMQNIFDERTRDMETIRQEIAQRQRALEVLTSDPDYVAAKSYLHNLTIKEALA